MNIKNILTRYCGLIYSSYRTKTSLIAKNSQVDAGTINSHFNIRKQMEQEKKHCELWCKGYHKKLLTWYLLESRKWRISYPTN